MIACTCIKEYKEGEWKCLLGMFNVTMVHDIFIILGDNNFPLKSCLRVLKGHDIH